MRLLFVVCLFASSLSLEGQKTSGKISGAIYSDSSSVRAAGATVRLIHAADSPVERIIASQKKGHLLLPV